MPTKKVPPTKAGKKTISPVEAATRAYRNFPKHSLESAMPAAQKIQDENGGKPMNRLLLAEALALSPSSSNFREILSSSYKYGLTDGTEKADTISLTSVGEAATGSEAGARLTALRTAALKSPVFGQFFKDFTNKKLPSPEMLPKVLSANYAVPKELTAECAGLIEANGKFVQFIREIGGSPHILLGAEATTIDTVGEPPNKSGLGSENALSSAAEIQEAFAAASSGPTAGTPAVQGPKPIFVAHGKNKAPLQQLQALLTSFRIPHKVVIDEAHLGRPISQKVRDTLQECGSAILIFTRDEQFADKDGKEVWRPSENVVYELGATSYLYGDRIVIFKEKGIHFPTNFQNIGYIEFENNDLQARTADLLKELIGFGLVRVTPT
jgi:predicted nucleotide-binding protein